MNTEQLFKSNIIKSIEQFKLLEIEVKFALDNGLPVNVIIKETKEEAFERCINSMIETVKEMIEYHKKNYKELEEKHIVNYMQQRHGYIKKEYWKEFKKRMDTQPN